MPTSPNENSHNPEVDALNSGSKIFDPVSRLKLRRKGLPPALQIQRKLSGSVHKRNFTTQQRHGSLNSASGSSDIEKAFESGLSLTGESVNGDPVWTEGHVIQCGRSVDDLQHVVTTVVPRGESRDAPEREDPGKCLGGFQGSRTTVDSGLQRSRPSLRKKVIKAVKQRLQSVWSEDESPGEETKYLWAYNQEPEKSPDSPFFNVQCGIRFQDIVPERPAQFPYPSQMAYASPYGSTLVPLDTKGPCNEKSLATREEERLREISNRKALIKLKALGQFRRRPNIKLDNVPNRSTDPVEVARIRRIYSGSRARQPTEKKGAPVEKLLEKMNRQARSGIIEWSVVRVEPLEATVDLTLTHPVITTSKPALVKAPILGQPCVSRRSLRRTVSTRVPGGPRKRVEYESKGPRAGQRVPRSVSVLTMGTDATLIGSLQGKTQREIPDLVITSCQSPAPTSGDGRPHSLASYFFSHNTCSSSSDFLQPSYGSESPSRIGNVREIRDGSGLIRSRRTSVSSQNSTSSKLSTVSSLANSIYSTLSEDWNRPVYYVRSKSRRYPASLQTNIQELPPHTNLRVLVKSDLVIHAETESDLTRVVQHVKSRKLKDLDGGTIQPAMGDRLFEVGFRITLEPIKDDSGGEEDKSRSVFARACCTARPTDKDMFGFVEYDEREDIHGDSLNVEHCEEGGIIAMDSIDETDPQKRILDVNDTSSMKALGIEPFDPHPDPQAFYRSHYAYFQEHGCFRIDSFDDPVARDGAPDFADPETSVVSDHVHPAPALTEHTFRGSVGWGQPARQVASKSGVVLRQAYKSLRKLVHGSSRKQPPLEPEPSKTESMQARM
ncbi:MAG: hypothetical protein J3Q66DRAFT_369619 [Benniella sp.]|nr:MAG: hypothetical protein J3Q66DRAFT_369619 [Benniella sp.]